MEVIILEGKEALLTRRHRSQWQVFKFTVLVTARIITSLHALAHQHNHMKTTVQLSVFVISHGVRWFCNMCLNYYIKMFSYTAIY